MGLGIRDAAKRALFAYGQRAGFNILPKHLFNSETPDIQELIRHTGWKRPGSMIGVPGAEDLDAQLAFVQDCVDDRLRELVSTTDIHSRACAANDEIGYGPIEAEVLFCFMARHQPQRIIQVGAGVATSVMLEAAAASGYKPTILCIDPYPGDFLKAADARGEITLVPKKCQDVELELFCGLGPGDLLFIDSTHTVKPGSEVNQLILEVLPRMATGSFVHFHDIYFPYDYQADILSSLWFWNESTLLHAFLMNNFQYRIMASLSMLHYARPQELSEIFAHYRPEQMDHGLRPAKEIGHFPSSLYLKAVS